MKYGHRNNILPRVSSSWQHYPSSSDLIIEHLTGIAIFLCTFIYLPNLIGFDSPCSHHCKVGAPPSFKTIFLLGQHHTGLTDLASQSEAHVPHVDQSEAGADWGGFSGHQLFLSRETNRIICKYNFYPWTHAVQAAGEYLDMMVQ